MIFGRGGTRSLMRAPGRKCSIAGMSDMWFRCGFGTGMGRRVRLIGRIVWCIGNAVAIVRRVVWCGFGG